MAPVVALALPSLGQLPAVTKFNAVPGLMFTRLREFPFPQHNARKNARCASEWSTNYRSRSRRGQLRLRQRS